MRRKYAMFDRDGQNFDTSWYFRFRSGHFLRVSPNFLPSDAR